jgi:5-deoxy-D-glucuronate isomerase
MRLTLTTGQTIEIKTESARVVNLALISGEVNYRIGDNAFDDTADFKLTEDVRTDSIWISSPTTIHVKAIADSVIQYRRE